uniref:Putative secreted protein n=1 Tax=Anopheles marajoara TaxID=58244 RepID=A0A2M4C7D4_9DIPT
MINRISRASALHLVLQGANCVVTVENSNVKSSITINSSTAGGRLQSLCNICDNVLYNKTCCPSKFCKLVREVSESSSSSGRSKNKYMHLTNVEGRDALIIIFCNEKLSSVAIMMLMTVNSIHPLLGSFWASAS